MRKIITTVFMLAAVTIVNAQQKVTLHVTGNQLQKITGFGAACCFGAMEPFAKDTKPVELLYGDESAIGLNIMRMEIACAWTAMTSSSLG